MIKIRKSLNIFLICIIIVSFNYCSVNSFSSSNNLQKLENCNYYNIKDKIEIVFAEFEELLQKYGYTGIYSKPKLGNSISYNKLVGKHGKIMGIVTDDYGISSFYKILLNNCEIVYAHKTILNNEYNIHGMYAISQLNEAKNLISSIIWIRQDDWKLQKQTLITENKNISYPIDHLEEVQVVDVYTKQLGHSYGPNPFFLMVKKSSGEIGYVGYIDSNFHINNPIIESWGDKIISLIKEQKLSLGMTEKQVLLSWGEPKTKNRSVGSWGVHEQWIYGYTYLYFENGILTSFQD